MPTDMQTIDYKAGQFTVHCARSDGGGYSLRVTWDCEKPFSRVITVFHPHGGQVAECPITHDYVKPLQDLGINALWQNRELQIALAPDAVLCVPPNVTAPLTYHCFEPETHQQEGSTPDGDLAQLADWESMYPALTDDRPAWDR